MLHKYVGNYTGVDDDGNPIITPVAGSTSTPITTQIQDLVLLENRDRRYDPNVLDLRGVYQQAEFDFNLSAIGILPSDTLYVKVHLNDMLARVGRKIIAGDVIELPNMRDDALLNGGPAINKYYAVVEAKRDIEGFQATWWPHIWRLKCEPMTASQEYADILNQPTQNPFGIDGGTLGSLITSTSNNLDINAAIVEQAQELFLKRNFETRQFWIVPGDNQQSAWIFAGDGIPPNGAVLGAQGETWPETGTDGEYFLRTDLTPHQLYMYKNRAWLLQEIDYRSTWTAASTLMMSFINNKETATFNDGTTQPSRQYLYQAVTPKADF